MNEPLAGPLDEKALKAAYDEAERHAEVITLEGLECAIRAYLANSTSSAAPAEAVKRWPFVETPVQFADRLAEAMTWAPSLLSALRHVLIENPAAIAPSTPDAAPVVRGLEFGWKCNCCGTVFTASKAKRDDDNEGGAKCPYCKAYGQYTYRYDLHEGDPCIHCDKLDTAVTITDEMVERGLAAAEKAAAEFTFSKEGVAEGFTFERSFTDEFKERFRAIHRAALAASPPSTGAPDENDGLELCGNFSATDPITDEDRLAYWKGAYERMAARNSELCRAGEDILGHKCQFFPDKAWEHFEEMLATGGMTR